MDNGERIVAGLKLRWYPGRGGRQEHTVSRGDSPLGPWVESRFGFWVVDDPDVLLDQMTQDEFDRTDQRMPYFAEFWPSADSLMTRVLAGPPLDGSRVLDLGCGLGPCGLAAAWRGAQVIFFDWEPRALEIVAATLAEHDALPASVREHGGLRPRCTLVVGDWRSPPPLGEFDLILAADVLYERRNLPAVVDFLSAHLKSGAEAWVADQGRPEAEQFPAFARDADLDVESELLPPAEHGLAITLWHVRRPR